MRRGENKRPGTSEEREGGERQKGGIEEGKHEVLGGKNRKQGTCIELGGDF